MNNDLTERYIYAVTKRLPGKTREDVARELQTLIDDMLKERCGEVTPSEKDIRVVLTELGTPNELYEQYAGDGKKCLIGQPYYSTYVFVLKIVLACVAFGMTLSAVISGAFSEEEINWVLTVGKWIGMLWQGLMGAFAFVTLLFAFFYHKEIPIDSYSGLENLPPVPKKKERISKGECILGIGISVAFLIVFLGCPQIICAITDEGELIPVLSAEVIRSKWYFIVIFGALGLTGEIMKLIDGKYTKRVVATTVAVDLLSALLACVWLLGNNIMNPLFAEKISELFGEDGKFIAILFAHFQYFFLGVMLFALLLDIMTTVVKGRTEKL